MTSKEVNQSFIRGLFSALTVVLFSQCWVWYDKNTKQREAMFDLYNEIWANGTFLAVTGGAIEKEHELKQPFNPVLFKSFFARLTTSAFDRSGMFLAGEPSDSRDITQYYLGLKVLSAQSQFSLDWGDSHDQKSQEEEKGIETLKKMSDYLFQNQDKLGPQLAFRKQIAGQIAAARERKKHGAELADKVTEQTDKALFDLVQKSTEQSRLALAALDRIWRRVTKWRICLNTALAGLPLLILILYSPTSLDVARIRGKRILKKMIGKE